MLKAFSMIVKSHMPFVGTSPQDSQSNTCDSQLGVDILSLMVHMVDLEPTIPNINVSTTP